MFIQREQALLVHIQELHSHLVAVTTQNTQSSQPGSNGSSGVAQDPVVASYEKWYAGSNSILDDAATANQHLATGQDVMERNSAVLEGALPQELAPKSVAELEASSAKYQVPQGAPPHVSLGSDDIYWVNQLQSGLMKQGYYCGEEEMEDFIFESGTESAVLAFQVIDHILCVFFCGANPARPRLVLLWLTYPLNKKQGIWLAAIMIGALDMTAQHLINCHSYSAMLCARHTCDTVWVDATFVAVIDAIIQPATFSYTHDSHSACHSF